MFPHVQRFCNGIFRFPGICVVSSGFCLGVRIVQYFFIGFYSCSLVFWYFSLFFYVSLWILVYLGFVKGLFTFCLVVFRVSLGLV